MKLQKFLKAFVDVLAIEKRGLVATVYLDNTSSSTESRLKALENGDYGPFYNE